MGKVEEWAADVVAQIKKEHGGHFDAFSSTANFALNFVETLSVESGDQRRVIAATLFLRLFQAARSVAVLANCGDRQDAAALVRICFETLVLLTNVSKTDGFAESYVSDVKRQSVRFLAKGLKDNADLLDDESRSSYREVKADIEKQIEREGIKRLPPLEQLASKRSYPGSVDSLWLSFVS